LGNVEEVATGASEDSRAIVLCVDDEPLSLELLHRTLGRDHHVLSALSVEEALHHVRTRRIAVVISDLVMNGPDGLELMQAVGELQPSTRRVVITGHPDSERLGTGLARGWFDQVLAKPWRPSELAHTVTQLARSYRLEQENARLHSQLRAGADGHEPLRDPLTGLYNHRALHERLREECARAERSARPISLLFADVDGLEAVNRDFGFQAGDDLLKQVATIIASGDASSHARSSDIPARFSGEEFVVILPDTSKGGALTRAMRIRDMVQRAVTPDGRHVSLSVGVACFPDDATSADGLLKAAEAALGAAKTEGKGSVHYFEGSDLARAKLRPGAITSAAEIDPFRPYHERIAAISAMLERDRVVSGFYVDLSRLRRVEQELGMAHHAEIFERAGNVLGDLCGSLLRPKDMVCRTGEGDGYVIILSPRPGQTNDDLERLASAVEKALETGLAAAVRAVLRDTPRITVGWSRVLGNSMMRPERLLARLVAEATESACLARTRSAHREKGVLQDIILGEGLYTVFQPIVHLETGEIFGYEALTRGQRETGMESPATLFAVADEVSLTFELDRACFRGALRSAAGLEPVHRLFVNLLPHSFYDGSFIEGEIGQLLEGALLTPANIVFEITERLAIENFASFRRVLAAYAAQGFGVAIDDVGTRHSNLETVLSLRPDFIKLSDVLIRGVARSTVKREMLRSLGRIAEAVDAVIVAEGIETADDLLCLRDLGIRYGQGYFIARPAPDFPAVRPSVKHAIRSQARPGTAPEIEDDGETVDAAAEFAEPDSNLGDDFEQSLDVAPGVRRRPRSSPRPLMQHELRRSESLSAESLRPGPESADNDFPADANDGCGETASSSDHLDAHNPDSPRRDGLN
jgi:diguanylate cyclase (GGDEF)-like protein